MAAVSMSAAVAPGVTAERSGLAAAEVPAATPVGEPASYRPFRPTRVLDTRTACGRLRAGEVTTIDVGATLEAQLANFGQGSPPNVSSLNFAAGATIPNFADAEIRDGRFGIYSGDAGGHHVLFDLTGWFTPE